MSRDWEFIFLGQLITVEVDLFNFRIGLLIDRHGIIAHPLPFITIHTEPAPKGPAE
jgi:hypothetical protein